MTTISNNGVRITVQPSGNKFLLFMLDGDIELEMQLSAAEMKELVENATDALSEMIYD